MCFIPLSLTISEIFPSSSLILLLVTSENKAYKRLKGLLDRLLRELSDSIGYIVFYCLLSIAHSLDIHSNFYL